MTAVDFTFPHAFACEVMAERPGGATRIHHVPADRAAGQDGLLVRVTPDGGEPWIGMFAFGERLVQGVDWISSMPDPRRLCVVARGAGYIVPADSPERWEALKAGPVRAARVCPAAGLLVFASHTELVAYGARGLAWTTRRVAWDGLTITGGDATTLAGEYFDRRTDAMQRFEVDLATGATRGGLDD